MRRAIGLLIAAAVAAGTLGATRAEAHPLGNFSINHLTRVTASEDGLHLRYILDQAEIPTFQERGISAAAVLARKRDEVARGLTVTVDGRPLALRFVGATLSHPAGQAGLPLTRAVFDLDAPGARPGRVRVHDATFPDRVGWKAIVARPGRGTAVRSSAPSGDPTGGLRHYPRNMLSSPLNERSATLSVRAGAGTLVAPPAPGGRAATTHDRTGDGFAEVFGDAASGKGALIFLLLAAFAWGAFHALSPGHGKAMVAAYLVGTRGTPRHALALGLTVTVTHTIGVFALGLVTLALSQYVLPEQLYPWLNLASGLLVVIIGAGVLRARLRARRSRVAPAGAHSHSDSHSYSHSHSHPHSHDHHVPHDLSWKALLSLGASAGLIPCPSALVVLLGAIAQHQVGLGLVMIVVFSLGLATTLTVLGVIVVSARRVTSRLSSSSRLITALPSISALVILGTGCLLTARAVPQLV